MAGLPVDRVGRFEIGNTPAGSSPFVPLPDANSIVVWGRFFFWQLVHQVFHQQRGIHIFHANCIKPAVILAHSRRPDFLLLKQYWCRAAMHNFPSWMNLRLNSCQWKTGVSLTLWVSSNKVWPLVVWPWVRSLLYSPCNGGGRGAHPTFIY